MAAAIVSDRSSDQILKSEGACGTLSNHQSFSSRTIAAAAIPSPLPKAPRPSGLDAFMFRRDESTSKAAASLAFIIAIWLASFGRCAKIVRSALAIRQFDCIACFHTDDNKLMLSAL